MRTTYADTSAKWACARKKSVTSEAIAKKVVAKWRDQEVYIDYYACSFCGEIHFTHAATEIAIEEVGPKVTHPYWEETGKSPRRICCSAPREDHMS